MWMDKCGVSVKTEQCHRRTNDAGEVLGFGQHYLQKQEKHPQTLPGGNTESKTQG